jgi:hypothetical protein
MIISMIMMYWVGNVCIKGRRLMGFRAVVTNLLMAVLLGCPYVCLGETGTPRAEVQRVGQSSCDCCGPNQPAPDRPDGNGSDGQRRSCLCGGALIEAPPRMQAPDAEILATLADHHILAPADPAAANRGPAALLCSHSPPPRSGKFLRAMIESYLL